MSESNYTHELELEQESTERRTYNFGRSNLTVLFGLLIGAIFVFISPLSFSFAGVFSAFLTVGTILGLGFAFAGFLFAVLIYSKMNEEDSPFTSFQRIVVTFGISFLSLVLAFSYIFVLSL